MDLTDRARLRAELRTRRERLPAAQRIAAATGLATVLEQLPEFVVDQRVAGYWAVAGELPLHLVLGALLARGQQYHLPVLVAGRQLRFAAWQRDVELKPNRYGIPEPQGPAEQQVGADAMELVLVPLVGFDRRGNRLGSGAGYYDRSFAFLKDASRPAQPLLVGIGYSFQEVSALPAQSWDVRMDFIATERELIECAAGC